MVRFHRALADEELEGNFGVGQAIGHQTQHFQLALAQAQGRAAVGREAARVGPAQQRQPNSGTKKWPPGRHGDQAVSQFDGRGLFEEVAVRAQVEGPGHVVFVGEFATSQHAQLRVLLAQGWEQRNSLGTGEAEVEQHHARCGGRWLGQQFLAGADLAHYFQAQDSCKPQA